MKSRKVTLIIIAALVMSSFAFAQDNAVAVSDIEAEYSAPVLIEQVDAQRVFYAPGREVEGFVTLEMLVDEVGDVEKVRVTYRTSKLAVANAVEAAELWQFEPATLDNTPVKAWVSYNIAFGPDLENFADASYSHKIEPNTDTFALLK